MRKPIASDMFYAGDPAELSKQIRSFLTEPEKDVKNQVKVAIAPHAGYIYSGKCAGEVYSKIRARTGLDKIETIILLGPNHSGIGVDIGLSFQSFLTPLGRAEHDLEIGKLIFAKAKNENLDVGENEDAHNIEHSLEVQLPFLQTIFKEQTKIVPILLKDLPYNTCVNLARVIYSAIQESNKNVFIIISSDFTHYGEVYGFIPFKDNIRANLYHLENKVIGFILNFDSKNFYEFATKNTTICGIFAITVGIELAKMLGCKKAEKVCFYNSGDVTGDYSNSVNYAGIVFE